MARRQFLTTTAHYVLNPADGLPVANSPGTVWTRQVGGTRLTDLRYADDTGADIGAVPSGNLTTDGNGFIPSFLGPTDDTRQMWADWGALGGARKLIVATDPDTATNLSTGVLWLVSAGTTHSVNTGASFSTHPDLTGALTSGLYRIDGLIGGSAKAAVDLRIKLDLPAGSTSMVSYQSIITTSSNLANHVWTTLSQDASEPVGLAVGGVSDIVSAGVTQVTPFRINGLAQIVAGTFGVSYCQLTTDAANPASLKPLSHINFTRVSA